jgi:hypothetical protein
MTDDIVKQLRDSACGNNCRCQYCNRNKAAADEIERLLAERDEARRELCNRCYGRLNARGAANLRGWDCFPD